MEGEQATVQSRFVPPPGYTQVPNALFDEYLPACSGAEFKVLMMLARQTFGWGRTKRVFTTEEIAGLCEIARQTAGGALADLYKKGFIGRRHLGANKYEYGIPVAKDDAVRKPDVRKPDSPSPDSPPGSNTRTTTRDGNKKAASRRGKKSDARKKGNRETYEPEPDDPIDQAIVKVFEHWANGTDDPDARLTVYRASKIRARLSEKARGHSSDEIEVALSVAVPKLLFAVDGMIHSQWHRDNGQQDFSLMFRSEEQIDKFAKRRRAQVGKEEAAANGDGDFSGYGAVVERA